MTKLTMNINLKENELSNENQIFDKVWSERTRLLKEHAQEIEELSPRTKLLDFFSVVITVDGEHTEDQINEIYEMLSFYTVLTNRFDLAHFLKAKYGHSVVAIRKYLKENNVYSVQEYKAKGGLK